MTYELLLKPLDTQRRPYLLFIFTFVIATLAIFVSYSIFPRYASVLFITFSIIPLVPLMTRLIEMEELRFEKAKRWWRLRNYRILWVYFFIFIGFVIAFSFWYTVLPSDVGETLFEGQIDALYERDPTLAKAVGSYRYPDTYCDSGILSKYIDTYPIRDCTVADFYRDGDLEYIIQTEGGKRYVFKVTSEEFVPYHSFIRSYYFFSNLQLLFFIFLTSFIFGAGALFVLVWNASIIGVFIGEVAHRLILLLSFGHMKAYFTALPVSLFRLILHGIPEFLGFFISAFAGGMISVAVIRHGFTRRSLKIIVDGAALFGVSVVLIFIAAFLESL